MRASQTRHMTDQTSVSHPFPHYLTVSPHHLMTGLKQSHRITPHSHRRPVAPSAAGERRTLAPHSLLLNSRQACLSEPSPPYHPHAGVGDAQGSRARQPLVCGLSQRDQEPRFACGASERMRERAAVCIGLRQFGQSPFRVCCPTVRSVILTQRMMQP